jgi:hypothetical protein
LKFIELLTVIKIELSNYQTQLHQLQTENEQLQTSSEQLVNSKFLLSLKEQLTKNELIIREKWQKIEELKRKNITETNLLK